MTSLPPPPALERIARGLATLDALISEEWSYRYYSFNAHWAPGARLASMRDGCGDEWFLVFTDAGAFLKGLAHELPRADAGALYAGMPAAFAPHLAEPAFSPGDVSYGGWSDGGAWTLRSGAGIDARMRDHLSLLQGVPADYREYADDYFEIDVPLAVIEHVLAGRPLDARLVATISQRSLAGLAGDLAQIGYTGAPRPEQLPS